MGGPGGGEPNSQAPGVVNHLSLVALDLHVQLNDPFAGPFERLGKKGGGYESLDCYCQ